MKKKIFMLMLAASLLFTSSFAFADQLDMYQKISENPGFSEQKPASTSNSFTVKGNYVTKYGSNKKIIWRKKVKIKNLFNFIGIPGGGYAALKFYPLVKTESKVQVYKFDSNLNVTASSKAYYLRSEGTSGDVGFNILSDGGFILSGNKWSRNWSSCHLIKLDKNCKEIWRKQFGEEFISSYYNSIVSVGTKGTVMMKMERFDDDDTIMNSVLYTFDKNGNEKRLPINDKVIRTINATPDGGFIITGKYGSSTSGKSNAVIIKLDKNGNELWSQELAEYYDVKLILQKDGSLKGFAGRYLEGLNYSYQNMASWMPSDPVTVKYTPFKRSPEPKQSNFKISRTKAGKGQIIRFSGSKDPNGGTLKRVFINISSSSLENTDWLYRSADVNRTKPLSLFQSLFPPLTAGKGQLKQQGTYWIRLWAQNEGNAPTLLKEVKLNVNW